MNEVEIAVCPGFFDVFWGEILDLGRVGSLQFFQALASDQFFELGLRLVSGWGSSDRN